MSANAKKPSGGTGLHIKNKREKLFLLSVWIVPIILFAVLYVYVNFNSILLAFKHILSDDLVEYEWTTDNFSLFWNKVFDDPQLEYAVTNSIWIYLFNIFVNTPLQMLLAFLIYKKVHGTSILKVIFFLPQIISSIAWVLMFRYFDEFGLGQLAVPFGQEQFLDRYSVMGFWTLVLFSGWLSLGGSMVLYCGTFSRIPDSVIEAGKLDGMNLMQEFVHVALPLVYPLISVALVTSVPSIFTNQLCIYAFWGAEAGPKLYTLGYFMFTLVMGSGNIQGQGLTMAAAGGIMITLVVAPLTLGMRALVNKFDPEVSY